MTLQKNVKRRYFLTIVTNLFIRSRKFKICQAKFVIPKNNRLNSTHYFINRISYKQKFQQIAFNDLFELSIMKIYRKSTKKLYSILALCLALAASDSLVFYKNLMEHVKIVTVTFNKRIMEETLIP